VKMAMAGAVTLRRNGGLDDRDRSGADTASDAMPKQASLLLFKHLQMRKLEDASAAGAAGCSSLLLHEFCTFVSSSGRVGTLADTDVPVRCAQPIVVQGLRCLARLPAPADGAHKNRSRFLL